jgi:hypothetical protein
MEQADYQVCGICDDQARPMGKREVELENPFQFSVRGRTRRIGDQVYGWQVRWWRVEVEQNSELRTQKLNSRVSRTSQARQKTNVGWVSRITVTPRGADHRRFIIAKRLEAASAPAAQRPTGQRKAERRYCRQIDAPFLEHGGWNPGCASQLPAVLEAERQMERRDGSRFEGVPQGLASTVQAGASSHGCMAALTVALSFCL